MAAKKKGASKKVAPESNVPNVESDADAAAAVYDGPPMSAMSDGELPTRPRKGKKRAEKKFVLQITSLLDILTIILVFFLKNYSTEPVKVTPSEDLKLPESAAQLTVTDAVPITITKRALLVNDKAVVEIRNGKIDGSAKRDGATGYFITPLFDALSSEAEKQKNIAQRNPNQSFEGMANLIADRDTPYRLLSEVMYTAGQAEFGRFKFAVVKGGE